MTAKSSFLKSKILLSTIAFSTIATIFPTAAQAEDAREHVSTNIAGAWVFETGSYNQGRCNLTGRMTIMATPQPNAYTCEFTTYERCPGQYGEVEQTCSLLIDGDEAAFVSQIENIVKQTPQPYGYAPDDWRLTIKSNDEMVGTLESASRAYVLFKRDSAPIS
ncbi:hypothetical protein [Hirschia baltica]|uniref:Lipocalin-like domain-containing protein n=1 Tax=Hirschia baltica (strain ATCC 49814 / DSM 5838 / IFAM 1418) TaxID=582402 RepID=C6XRJ3_HIRBI|nr:hypothetical protein [Hirschia baltica]ACT58825.1 hypothetical protein Hbal_1133 [Hirschia baltica ATCC 49814]